MITRISFLLFIVTLTNIEAFVRRDVSSSTPNVLESFQRNIDQFRKCIDQSLANAADEVNVKHLEPVLGVIGDQLNRISKAYEDLTAPSTSRPGFK